MNEFVRFNDPDLKYTRKQTSELKDEVELIISRIEMIQNNYERIIKEIVEDNMDLSNKLKEKINK